MAYETRVTLYPDIPAQPNGSGGFLSSTFADLLQREIDMPGLDVHWTHTLMKVQVAADRNSAELTVHSAPIAPKSLDRTLRLVTGLPAAHIRALDTDGVELAVAKHDAPLRVGEWVEVAGERYRVAAATWPHRDPDSGTCRDGIDYQHVTVVPDPAPEHLPTLATP